MDDDVSCRLEAEEHMIDLTVVLAHSSEPFKVCFCLWATKNGVPEDFLLPLCSDITPGGIWDPYGIPGINQLCLVVCKAIALPTVLILWPLSKVS